ncbi:MAG: T9SS type A sorting domain-containing protein [Opitutaceae bacterium]|nr:T9SS type A sorting domain-containing protein [Cytophagales bacterium]
MKKLLTITIGLCFALGSQAQINTGSPAKPFNSNTGYANGILPTNLPSGGSYGKSSDAAIAYDSWKSRFVQSCGTKGSLVKFEPSGSVVSEGIAYGMLLAAYAGDKPLFDDLWKFYKNSSSGGIMDWKWSSCTSKSQNGGATDAELDVAMALIVAADQWPSGSYLTDAKTLVAIIRASEVTNNQFNNGNTWGQTDCRNPSYQSPAYAREYAKIESNQSTFWNNVVTGNNALLRANRNANTGLVSNWSNTSGAANNCNGPNEYGYESVRNPWRMVTDVIWHGRATGTDNSNTSLATEIADKMANWAKNDVANFKGPVSTSASSPNSGPDRNGAFTTYALPFMVASGTGSYQTTLNGAYTNVVNIGNNDTYFNSTLRCISLFTLTGNFWLPGSNLLTATLNITSPLNNASYDKGVAVPLTATATVSTGTVAKVEYYDGGTLLGLGTGSTFAYSATTLTGGIHTLTAKSYDATGKFLTESPGITVIISGASDISSTGVLEFFEKTTPIAELTGGKIGTSCASANTAATTGVYWFDDIDPATPFAATFTRAGDGVLTYKISNAAKSYNVIGFNFGEYCKNGVKTKYAVDLSGNAVLKFTVKIPKANSSMELKIVLKDSAGHVLAFNKNVIKNDTIQKRTYYVYDIGFSKNHPTTDFGSLKPDATLNETAFNFSFDFKNALTVKDPAVGGGNNINLTNADFNFKKVVEVAMTPLSSTDVTGTYDPAAYTNQTLIFSNLSLGNVALGLDMCTIPETPTVSSPVTVCQGSVAAPLTAKGLTGLNLQWYETATLGTGNLTAPTPATSVVGPNNYYVSQKVGTGTCEGPRSSITVNVIAPPTANAGVAQGNAKGPSVTLNGTGSAVGTWKLVTGQTGATVTFAPSANAESVTANGLTVLGDYTFNYTVAGAASCVAASSNVVVTVTTITALENDTYLNENIEIYPNPATDNLFVNLSKVNGSKSMKMLDMFGRVVFESSNQNSFNVDMSNFNKGMYVVQIQGESGKLSRSVIKQ